MLSGEPTGTGSRMRVGGVSPFRLRGVKSEKQVSGKAHLGYGLQYGGVVPVTKSALSLPRL